MTVGFVAIRDQPVNELGTHIPALAGIQYIRHRPALSVRFQPRAQVASLPQLVGGDVEVRDRGGKPTPATSLRLKSG